MAMGTRKKHKDRELWYGGELRQPQVIRSTSGSMRSWTTPASMPLRDQLLGFYHHKLGRPSLPPGLYFRVMMIGFFKGWIANAA